MITWCVHVAGGDAGSRETRQPSTKDQRMYRQNVSQYFLIQNTASQQACKSFLYIYRHPYPESLSRHQNTFRVPSFPMKIKKDKNGIHTHGVAANVDVFTAVHQKSSAAAVRDLVWPVLPGRLWRTEGGYEDSKSTSRGRLKHGKRIAQLRRMSLLLTRRIRRRRS